jgi:hypothetical protein
LKTSAPQAITSLAELFSRPNWLKSQPIAVLPSWLQSSTTRPHVIFKPAFGGRVLLASFRFADDRPVRQIGAARLCNLPSKMLFAVSADSFSPQGVRRVGPQLFENSILLLFRERRSFSWATYFRQQGWPNGLKRLAIEDLAFLIFAHRIQPLGSNFQTRPMALGVKAP